MSGWWTPLFCGCAGGERPGGLELTERAAEYCGFGPASCLLDVAAGDGGTVRFLRERFGCQIAGLDSDPARRCPDVALGRAEALPFPDGAFDGVFIECALSQMERPEEALGECARVLRSGGNLVLSDLYAGRGGDASTPLGRLDSREELTGRLGQAGLEPVFFEDHTGALTSLWAGAMMSGRGCELAEVLRGPGWPSGVKCGYYLCAARKKQKAGESCERYI